MNQISQKASPLSLPPFHPPPPSAFSSFDTLTHLPFTFRTFVLFCFAPFCPAENQSKLIEQSSHTVLAAYGEVSSEDSRQQTFVFCFTVWGCSKYTPLFHGTVNPFCAMMLWPGPILLSFLMHCSGELSLLGDRSVALTPTPASVHLFCSLSHLWRRNIVSISFCCFWPLHINISKHKLLCVPFLAWRLVHSVESSKTPTLQFWLGKVMLHSPWPSLPLLVASRANSDLSTATLFLPFLGISPKIFTFVNWQVLYNVSRDATALTACFFPCVHGWNLFNEAFFFTIVKL